MYRLLQKSNNKIFLLRSRKYLDLNKSYYEIYCKILLYIKKNYKYFKIIILSNNKFKYISE